MIDASRNTFAEPALNLLRIVSGFLFMQHGLQKLFGLFGGMGGAGNTVPVASLLGTAGVIELVGGVLLILGLWTRPVAFVASGEMAFAYFMRHAPNGFWPIVNRGEIVALYSFVLLFLAANGGGAWSVDGWLARRRKRGISAGTIRSARSL